METAFHTLKGVLAILDLVEMTELAYDLEVAARNRRNREQVDYEMQTDKIQQVLNPFLNVPS